MDNERQNNLSPDGDREFTMPFRSSESSDPMPESTWTVGMRLYCQVWDEYRQAGMPFGSSDDAMIVWYTFHPSKDFDLYTVSRN